MLKFFKPKPRIDILDSKIRDILNDLLISDFNNSEVALILNSVREEGKIVLEHRKTMLEQELNQTVKAINSL